MSSSPLSWIKTSSLSMSISRMLSMTTIRLPWSPFKMWFKSVVFPELWNNRFERRRVSMISSDRCDGSKALEAE